MYSPCHFVIPSVVKRIRVSAYERSGMMILDHGQRQSLDAILDNREWRAHLQETLMDSFVNGCIVAAKLNIPGAIKNNVTLQAIFRVGLIELGRRMQNECLCAAEFHYYVNRPTGPEAFAAFEKSDWTSIKRVAIAFEDDFALGRLFDIDVMRRHSVHQLSRTDLGMPARRCMVCEKPAKECARNQTHTASELAEAVERQYLAYCSSAGNGGHTAGI
ncbi:citrate lyase holo-[acyl-carrier protein] synthase [Bifidobacterium sp. ESL0784]|uniref:citrate lyase holo-[acyl-carrier protein] synthase n=1 Tax=Bifidobacterium sp. ESL0784 TaxID=2983231 RepID=UPI0032AF249E